MRKSKLQAANLEGNADDVEAAFYDALQNADLDKLMACWADEDEIVCIHPGGPRVVGPIAIRATFVHNLLEKVEVLTPQGPRVAWVIATNIWHKTAQGWRLVAHHASPGTPSEIQEVSDTPSVLH